MENRAMSILTVLWLLPILHMCQCDLRINHHIRSIQTLAKSITHSSRRILQDDVNMPPFVSAAQLFDHECWGDYNSDLCTYNDRMLLTTDAPEPQSDAGKWLAKLTAAAYLCEMHDTEDKCLSDTANSCDIVLSYNVKNSSTVAICTLSEDATNNITRQYFLCPNSVMKEIFTCIELQKISNVPANATIKDGCVSGDGVTCVYSKQQDRCLPSSVVNNFNLTDELSVNKLNTDIATVSEAVWGCCPGAKVYAKQQACATQLAKKNCTGLCQWTLPGVEEVDAFEVDNQFIAPPCILKKDAVRDVVLADVNTDFTTYLKAVQERCVKVNTTMNPFACYNTTAIKNGPSDKKALTYSGFQLTQGGGESPATCASLIASPPPPAMMGSENTTTNTSTGAGSFGSQSGQVDMNASVANGAATLGLGPAVAAAVALVCLVLLLV